jgi:hypothetical protein
MGIALHQMFVVAIKDGMVMTVARLIVEVAARMEAIALAQTVANAQVGIMNFFYFLIL